MKARSAATGLTLVEGFLATSLGVWIEALISQHFDINRWAIGIAFVALYSINDHFLVDRGTGIAFDKEFSAFPRNKRIALLLAAGWIVIASGVALYLSVNAYHQTPS